MSGSVCLYVYAPLARTFMRDREDNFQLELSRVRKEIESVFTELIDCLECRKKHLFDELNKILIRYQSYKRETDELSRRLRVNIGRAL